MGAAERRLETMKYLCRHRKATMPQLAKKFGVSVRTIQRDILEIEEVFRVPIDVRSGKHGGGVYVVGKYSYDHTYMHDDELALLAKVQKLACDKLTDSENRLLTRIIKEYTRTS